MSDKKNKEFSMDNESKPTARSSRMLERLAATSKTLEVFQADSPVKKSTSVGYLQDMALGRQLRQLKEQPVKMIRVDLIDPNPWQPRTSIDFNVEELKVDIQKNGLLQSVMVRISPHDSTRYELIAGERRLRAVQELKVKEIPAIVREHSDQEVAILALTENISRKDLTDYEIAQSIKRIKDEFNPKNIHELFNYSRSHLHRIGRMVELPPYIQSVLVGYPHLMSAGLADELIGYLNTEQLSDVELHLLWDDLTDTAAKRADFDLRTFRRSVLDFMKEKANTASKSKSIPVVNKIALDGKEVGSIKTSDLKMVISLNRNELSEDLEQQLNKLLAVYLTTSH